MSSNRKMKTRGIEAYYNEMKDKPKKKGEIVKNVFREDFDTLEIEMKEFVIGDKIKKLELK
jgi:hypothetical protein